METETDINTKIMKLISVMQDNYPELSKYIGEMPLPIPLKNNPDVNLKNLQNYYDSLVCLFREYVAEHQLNYINQKTENGHL